jgi:hypothetical protein
LYKSELFSNFIKRPAAKEIGNYAAALQKGFVKVRESRRLLTRSGIRLTLQHNMQAKCLFH